MKKLLLGLICLLSVTAAFAYEGMLAGQKDLKLIKTEFFDIIYTPDSEKAAAIIAEHGDDLYRELHDTYNLIHDFRLPVTITSSQDMFNAYFTHAPYNHIVLFDTQASATMAVFEEDLLMVFRHELTHAITINIKTPFWLAVSKIFGDMINPSVFIPTSGQLEGIAITEESRTGEGRLHSEFTRHIVKQAKLEDDFPNFAEITGARSIYVYDYNYKFGGEFMEYIRQRYGEEKLAEYWKRMTNLGGLSYFTIFKSVYGISMNEAWKDFKEDFPVPAIPADPTETGLVARFNSDKDFEQFDYVASAKDKIVYHNKNTAEFYYAVKDAASPTGYTEPKKFLHQGSIQSMNLSADGRYLTYVYLSTAGALPKNKMVIYDFETKAQFKVPEERLNNGVVFTITENGTEKKYLAANKNISQESSINIFRLEENSKGKLAGMELVETINNKFNNFSTNLQADENGTIYYLSKQGVAYIIKSYDFVSKVHKQYELPHSDMLIQGLSISPAADGSTRALFTYVQPGTMPRLGEARILPTGVEYNLYQQDLSGGIFAPVALGENHIMYVGNFLKGNHIYTANTQNLNVATVTGVVTDLGVRSEAENQAITFVDTSILNNAKDFSVWPYLVKGSWYPLSQTASYGLSNGLDNLVSYSSLLGATFMGTMPWTSPLYTLSAGYNTATKSGTFQTTFTGGTETNLFKYDIQNNLEVDGSGYKQTYHYINLSSETSVNSVLSIRLADSLDLFEGRQTLQVEKTAEEKKADSGFFKSDTKTVVDSRHIFFVRNIGVASINYQPLRGKGAFEMLNIAGSTFVDSVFAADITNFDAPLTNYNNLGLGLQIHVPQLLPVSTRTWGTGNLPFTATAYLYPSQSSFLETRGKLVLFSFELQKAATWFPIVFFNTITAEMEYVSKFSNGKNESWDIINIGRDFKSLVAGRMSYSDEFITRLALTVTPNLGTAASVHPTLNFDFKYRFFPEENEPNFSFNLGFKLAL